MKHLIIAATLVFTPGLAFAQMVVIGSGEPQACYMSAKTGDQGSLSAIRTCTNALSADLLQSDEAATYVNRGVLLMRRGEYDKAVSDYERALTVRPTLPEAHINHGVALYFLGEDARALSAFNTALELDTDRKAETLFNRALVHERQDNAKAAYYDLKAALELRPDWELAQKALTRFTVKSADS